MAQENPLAFFSYSRDDSEFALRLAKDLKSAHAMVWLDQLDISPGQHWDQAVEQALTKCPNMLLILSPSAVASSNVMDEVSFALDEQKLIIPVLYSTCKIPFRLRRLQYIDARKDYDRALEELLRLLSVNDVSAKEREDRKREQASQIAPVEATPEPASPQPAAAPVRAATREPQEAGGRNIRKIALPAIFALLIVLAIVLWRVSKNSDAHTGTGVTSVRTDSNPNSYQPPSSTSTEASVRPPQPSSVMPQCDAIRVDKSGLEWYVGPDRNMTLPEATAWVAGLEACGGNWRMPTIRELRTIYSPGESAGTGYVSGGKHWPAHLSPRFAAIGGGSWVWAADHASSKDSGVSFNFNQGVPATYRSDDTNFSTRAFAVRDIR